MVYVAVAANLLPAALLFYFVHRFGVDVPLFDEWDCFVIPLQRLAQGTLQLSDLFAQQNNHRMLFPRLLTLANAALFHWNRIVEMYVTAVLLTLCAWILFRFVRSYWAHPLTPLLFVPIAWMLFSWRQWENLLWGIGTMFSLLVTGAVLAFCLLHRTRTSDRFASAAAVAAFVASFSQGGGLLVWPIGLAQLLLQRLRGGTDDRPGPGAFAVWTGAATLTGALFFFRYGGLRVPWPTGLAYMTRHPGVAVSYVATMIGSPLSDRNPIAESLGVVVMALGAWAVFRLRRANKELVAAAPLLAFLVLTLLAAVTACDYRMGLGLGQALSSRYCSLTMLGLVALYALLTRFALTERRPATLLASGGMATLLIVGAITNLVAWSRDSTGWFDSFALRAYALRNIDVVSDEAISPFLHPDPEVVRARTPFLRAHGYSLFHQTVPLGLPARYMGRNGGCTIDTINGMKGSIIDVHLRDSRRELQVAGWAVDAAAGQEASRVFVSFDDRIDFPALNGFARPDVASAFRNPNYGASGFISYVRTSLITNGEHALELKIVGHDGASYWTCGASRIHVAE